MKTLILERRHGNVATLVLDGHGGLNILDSSTLVELRALLERLGRESSLQALILTGAGNRAFSAGANLNELAELTHSSALDFSNLGQTVTSLIADFPAPVVAALNGLTFGGGLELALACDFRIAEPTVRFSYPSSKLGILPGFGGTQRCPSVIGPSRTKELMFFGRVLTAEQALEWGLVNAIASHALDAANSWCEELVQRDAYSIRQTKEAIGMTEKVDYQFEQEAFANCFRQSGLRERLRNWQTIR